LPQQPIVSPPVVFLLVIVHGSIQLNCQHSIFQVEVDQNPAVSVQKEFLDFVQNSVTVNQLGECHLGSGTVAETLQPAPLRAGHHLMILVWVGSALGDHHAIMRSRKYELR
jgi:hypothetical protein